PGDTRKVKHGWLFACRTALRAFGGREGPATDDDHAEALHRHVEGGCEVEREELRQHQAPHGRDPEGPARLGTVAEAEGDRQGAPSAATVAEVPASAHPRAVWAPRPGNERGCRGRTPWESARRRGHSSRRS